MADYIPRSEAINELRHRCYPCGEGIEAINVIPAADVAPVVHGRWVDGKCSNGWANARIATMQVERDQQTKDCFEWQRSAQNLHDDLLNARERAHYAEAHPWRNLWAWAKRKLSRE
jgi:hypothetical protein